MKQTQTKMFDFSDVGLDFCAGSKSLFPDRFKKMLSLGYNEQTVSSVAVAGNQVTFTYGGTHGYVADRVLKVNAPELLSINGGEFVIDSATENTVTMTIDDAPLSISGGFTTKIASLGWSLEYENENIHVYKFKQLDESDIFIRLCFQNNADNRNVIAPCVGNSYDSETGYITDLETYRGNANILTPNPSGLTWEYQWQATSAYNFATYSVGYGQFGKAVILGSLYHLISMHSSSNNDYVKRICGVIPAATHYFGATPLLLGEISALAMNSYGESLMLGKSAAYIKKTRVIFTNTFQSIATVEENSQTQQAFSSTIPSDIDAFQTTTCEPIPLYIANNGQHLGFVVGGMYRAKYAATNAPPVAITASPSITADIDLNSKVLVHSIAYSFALAACVFFAVPIEEIKIA